MSPIVTTKNDYTQTLNLRDAAERAARIFSEASAKDLYDSAASIGDKDLMQAIEARAEAKGWIITPALAATKIHEAFVALVDSHKDKGAAVNDAIRSGFYTAEGAKDAADKFISAGRYTEKLDQIVKTATDAAAKAEAKVQASIDALTTPTGGTQDQILAEMRATKTWDRIKAEITGNRKVTSNAATLYELGRRITEATDPTTRRVILEESKSWLLGLGYPNDGTTDVDTHLRNLLIEGDPALTALNNDAKAANELAIITNHNANKLKPRLSTVPPSFDQEKHGQEPTRSGRAGYVGPNGNNSSFRTQNAVSWSARRR